MRGPSVTMAEWIKREMVFTRDQYAQVLSGNLHPKEKKIRLCALAGKLAELNEDLKELESGRQQRSGEEPSV